MNYYKQGDAAKAEDIKAAFEKLNTHSISGYDFSRCDVLFFSFTGKEGVKYMMSTNMDSWLADVITTHPDYKELELPAQPKFKVGDWLYHNTYGVHPILVKDYGEVLGYKVECIETTYYLQKGVIENEYHLWSIADAKEGDVLSIDFNGFQKIVIFKSLSHKGVEGYGITAFKDRVDFPTSYGKEYYSKTWTNTLTPATKEQRSRLFTELEKAGYKWDADKKQLRKIKQHYDISNFKPFDKVLVRDNSMGAWCCSFYSHYVSRSKLFFCAGIVHNQCIPYNEDTKHLIGTTEPCDACYINW